MGTDAVLDAYVMYQKRCQCFRRHNSINKPYRKLEGKKNNVGKKNKSRVRDGHTGGTKRLLGRSLPWAPGLSAQESCVCQCSPLAFLPGNIYNFL